MAETTTPPSSGGFFHDTFMFRLFRAFMSSPELDGQSSWSSTLSGIHEDERFRYHRLNVQLASLIELDDVAAMGSLLSFVEAHLDPERLLAIVRAIWAASFFFELHSLPPYQDGSYACHGIISCYRPRAHALIEHIIGEYPTTSIVTSDGHVLGTLWQMRRCHGCNFTRMDVHLEVQHEWEPIAIYLQYTNLQRNLISSCPHPLSWFIYQQRILDPAQTPLNAATQTRCVCTKCP